MATPTNTYVPTVNSFTASLVEKIGKQAWSSKAWSNPLAQLKKGFLDNANEIEEIYVNRLTAVAPDLTGASTLAQKKATVQTEYHKAESTNLYSVSISDKQVRKAFTTKDGIKSLADEILSQFQTGYQFDEYGLIKQSIIDFATNSIPTGAKSVITDVTDNASAKAFVKALKKDIGKMAFPSKTYCAFETHSTKDELVFVTTPDMVAEIDVELLASAFNVSAVEVPSRIIVVDSFPNAKWRGVLMDKGAVQVYGTLYNLETQRNAQGMFTNYHLNVEYIVSYSKMYGGRLYQIA